ncbi:MAG: hypothetical protein K0V04_32095 [Deltaproteobacteria bacterium]|nr:hypothetical protein [Deltaproteobacteria bacterium]
MDLAGAQDRTLRVTVWYPTATADDVVPLSTLVTAEDVSTFEDLLANAPAGCTRPAMDATLDAPLAAGSYPAIVFSHCLSCLGTSSTFIAERLASHGAIVVGVTHTGDTLFDQVEGNVAPLDAAWLSVRALDVGLTLDGVLDSEQFGPAIDTTRLGVFGHSYGAATTGKVLQDDDRFIAGVAIAAPLANPLLPGVAVTDIAEPMLMLLAQEDNSITEIGNNFMRADAMALPGGSWLVELADAGHWSFSDLCGIVEAFDPGCGDGTRQTVAGEAFTYLDNDLARDIAASYTTAFFALHLHEQPDAEQYLDVATPASVVTVVRHDP